MDDINITKWFLLLLYFNVFCPLIQIAAGALLIAAGKQLSKLNGNQRLITVCDILGVAFLFYITIATVHSLYLIIPIWWP
jgi:hypothetical protein